jgi:hypothetical protein
MNSFKLFVRSNDYKKFIRAVNKFIADGYELKRLSHHRRWIFWHIYMATFHLPNKASHVILDIGPITNRF